MKKILIAFLFLVFGFCSFSTIAAHADSLSFTSAPTVKDYVNVRGNTNLYKVLFGLAYHYYTGTHAENWDQLEFCGEELTKKSTTDQIAEFIFQNSFQVQITKFAFGLIMSQLKLDTSVVDKNYTDREGYYIPLSQSSVIARSDIYVDFANLFGVNHIFMTSRPFENGYSFENGDLYINDIEVTINSSRYAKNADKLDFMLTSSADKFSNDILQVDSITSDSVVLSRSASGALSELSFGRVYVSDISDVNSLLGTEIKVKIGDMTNIVKGLMTRELDSDLGVGKVLTLNQDAVIADWDWDNIYSGEADNANDSILDQILSALKQFFLPDFSNVSKKISELVDLFKSKFSSIFDIVDMFKNLFASSKSLHDLHYVVNGFDFYPFPREQTEEPFKVLKMILNVAIVLITLIRCYKRVVGEGDVIE